VHASFWLKIEWCSNQPQNLVSDLHDGTSQKLEPVSGTCVVGLKELSHKNGIISGTCVVGLKELSHKNDNVYGTCVVGLKELPHKNYNSTLRPLAH